MGRRGPVGHFERRTADIIVHASVHLYLRNKKTSCFFRQVGPLQMHYAGLRPLARGSARQGITREATWVHRPTIGLHGGPKTDPERGRKRIRQSALRALPESRPKITRTTSQNFHPPGKAPPRSSGMSSARLHCPASPINRLWWLSLPSRIAAAGLKAQPILCLHVCNLKDVSGPLPPSFHLPFSDNRQPLGRRDNLQRTGYAEHAGRQSNESSATHPSDLRLEKGGRRGGVFAASACLVLGRKWRGTSVGDGHSVGYFEAIASGVMNARWSVVGRATNKTMEQPSVVLGTLSEPILMYVIIMLIIGNKYN